MNQPSSRDTTATAAPTPKLSPALQAVLASLDVDIDTELARYRRQRRGEQLEPSFRTIGGEKVQKNLDLIQLTPTSSSQSHSELPNSAVAASGTPLPPPREQSAAPTTSLPFQPYTSAPIVPVSGNGAASPEASHTRRVEPEVVTTEPDDYLESSEVLLKSIDEENSRNISPELATTSRRKSKNFLTPLTVGSALLFVAASGTLAYALLNGGGGGNWSLKRLWPGESPAPTTAVTQPTPNPVANAEPKSPNLARREFVPLDVETLGTLDDGESSLPTPAPAQAPALVATAPQTPPPAGSLPEVAVATAPPVPGTAPTLPNAGGLENINTILLPESVKQKPTPPAPGVSPTAAATAPAVPADLAVPQFYYLLMEYKSDASLRQARDWVPDAYVREFPVGVRIQLGAYDDEPTAKEVAAELQQYGLPVVIYKP
ncbi:MAG TPA: hypothetical protein IGS52_24330 [Oscillatoriaceae cyanobacterium M33_DOE_052]|uniref:SPOR domain-containing protein n=1 Tax=Planktothricoides sp. SpSt-374 TaxID=2282167 RepID=A0A7C3VK07_9CYAN|nr:hypothetical protein [Oscillatoriaceae cyanobacterium M33_DOE_052]